MRTMGVDRRRVARDGVDLEMSELSSPGAIGREERNELAGNTPDQPVARSGLTDLLAPIGAGILGGGVAILGQHAFETSPLVGFSLADLDREFSSRDLAWCLALSLLAPAIALGAWDKLHALRQNCSRGLVWSQSARMIIGVSYALLPALATGMAFDSVHDREAGVLGAMRLAGRAGISVGIVLFVAIQVWWGRFARRRALDRALACAVVALSIYAGIGTLAGLQVGRPIPLSWLR